MKNKSIFIIVILFALVTFGGYFGLKKTQKSKKVVSISNEMLFGGQQEEVKNEQEIINNQSSVINNQEANSHQSSVIDNKKETSVKSAIAEEKISSKIGKIVSKFVSWGFSKSTGRTIKAIIIHTSYNNLGGDRFDFDKVIQEWKDFGVAPHYAVDRDGTVYQLVADNNIAWHAGVSKLPDGTTDVNGVSIGVEIINSQDAKFTDAQYSALNSLIATLKKKYPIKYVLGHDDIAPTRKTDPWGMEWSKVQK